MTQKVGLLVGREWSFPPAFIEEVNRRDAGVVAEFAQLGGTRMDEPCPYAVIIDRISHEVPYYRSYLKYALLHGVTVVNNPFMWSADDKFFEAALATELGVASPKTLVLPNKDYVPGIVHPDSLRNLIAPLDWQGIVEYVGLPCILKDAHGGGWKDVYVCHTLDELIANYDNSGLHDHDRAGVHRMGAVRPLHLSRARKRCCPSNTIRTSASTTSSTTTSATSWASASSRIHSSWCARWDTI